METRTVSGKQISLTPNADLVVIDPTVKASVNYAIARAAIRADFEQNMTWNEPLAKKLRRANRTAVIEHLKGTVSRQSTGEGQKKGRLIITFHDGSIANL